MIEQKVESVLKSSLKSISKKKGISLQYLRIRMKLTDDFTGAYCTAFDSNHPKEDLSWASILGFALPFKNVVVGSITGNLIKLSEQLNIDKREINARYYAVDNSGKADMILYAGDKAVKKININELI